jgi:hypothetical protein
VLTPSQAWTDPAPPRRPFSLDDPDDVAALEGLVERVVSRKLPLT